MKSLLHGLRGSRPTPRPSQQHRPSRHVSRLRRLVRCSRRLRSLGCVSCITTFSFICRDQTLIPTSSAFQQYLPDRWSVFPSSSSQNLASFLADKASLSFCASVVQQSSSLDSKLMDSLPLLRNTPRSLSASRPPGQPKVSQASLEVSVLLSVPSLLFSPHYLYVYRRHDRRS
jgi:hypothetical protein